MSRKTLTEKQYDELRRYEGGLPTWVYGGPYKSLVHHGFIRRDYGEMYSITDSGQRALAATRERWGLRV